MAITTIECQYTGCAYVAEHAAEAVDIAMLTSHNGIHQGSASHGHAVKQKVPKMDRPKLKQDINDGDWLLNPPVMNKVKKYSPHACGRVLKRACYNWHT